MAFRKNSRLHTYLAAHYVDFDLHNPTKRLNSLYSDFSKLALLNQYGYDANINYWRSIILDCNSHGLLGSADYRLALDAKELANQFLMPGIGTPLSLDCVLASR